MEKLNFESFSKKIYIASTLEKVYYCWATSEGIRSWFLKKAIYTNPHGQVRNGGELLQPNDQYLWEWHNWDGQEGGTFLEANGRDRVLFTFAGNCKVSVDLKKEGQKVLVSLSQYDIPTDEDSKINIHVGCSNGWTFWLANLKAWLEHGITLNETEVDLRQVPLSTHVFVNV